MIKPFVIVAQSLDGFIARNRGEQSTAWTSAEDRKNFVALTKRAKVMVMGSTTFDTIGKALPGRTTIVYTRNKRKYANTPDIETTDEEPEKLLERLERRGFEEAAICGGASIYTLFMERNLVDKMYVTIEAKLFGDGIKMFNKAMPFDLVLLSTKQLSPNTLALEYKVMR